MKKINVALIGYKFMGRAHSNAWRQAASFFDVPVEPVMKVIVGRHEVELAQPPARFAWQEQSTSWEETVNRPDIDVIDICTPGDTHLPIALAAARAGKVILCEKPLANNVADAERMLEAVRAAGVIHMLCHNYRRGPAGALAKRVIEEGGVGGGGPHRGPQ